jgi:hypothetical protein
MKKQILSITLALLLMSSNQPATDAAPHIPEPKHEALKLQEIRSFKEVLNAATEEAEQLYPPRGIGVAALFGVTISTATYLSIHYTVNFVVEKVLRKSFESNRDNSLPESIVTGIFAGSILAVSMTPCIMYEIWKQHRAAQKTRIIIEHLVAHATQHFTTLNNTQRTTFTPFIELLNEQGTLDSIKNPQAALTLLMSVI